MRCLLRAVVRRSRGVVSNQDRGFEGDHLTIGRSTDQDLYLSDLRVALHHATVVAAGAGRFVIQSAVPSGIRHNDEPVQSAFLAVGDQVGIGDHRITVRPPEGGHDLVLEIAQVRADPGQEVEKRVASASGSGPEKGLRLGVRGWSWILSMTILTLFFVVPLVAHQSGAMQGFLRGVIPGVSDHAWSTGGLTEGHRYFSDDCNKCHERAFVSVRASACAECHKDQPHHFDVERFKVPALADKQCAACHKEHGGAPALTRQDEGLCLDCHRDMKETAADSKLLDIEGGFAEDHPEFRATFVTHADGKDWSERIEIDRRKAPKERSNLFFPHKSHLDKTGVQGPDGKVVLACASCHVPEPGGRLMAPIRFEQHCHRCHQLTFEIDDPKREVPHGHVGRVLEGLEAYYGLRTLERADIDTGEPDVLSRRRPGRQATPPERSEGLESAARRARQAGKGLFEYRACATCHRVDEKAQSVFGWDIVPVRIARTWYPLARFDHGRHATVGCADCHGFRPADCPSTSPPFTLNRGVADPEKGAADCIKSVADSETSEDVLITGIATCRECHGDPGAKDRIQSTCISCHGFHISPKFAMDGRERPQPGDAAPPRQAAAVPPADLTDLPTGQAPMAQ